MKITRKTYYIVNFVLLFSVLIVAFVLASVIMYQDQKNSSVEKTDILTVQVSEMLNDTFNSANLISRNMFLNTDFQELADLIYTDDDAVKKIYEHFNLIISMDDVIKNTIYVPRNSNGELDVIASVSYGIGFEYITENLPRIVEIANNEEFKDGKMFYCDLLVNGENVAPYFALARNITDLRHSSYFEKMGVGILFLNKGQIEEKLNDYSFALDGVSFSLFSGNEQILSSDSFVNGSIDKQGYYTNERELETFSWNLVGVYDTSYIWKAIGDNFAILFILTLIAGASFIILLLFVKRKSTESLDYLFGAFSGFVINSEVSAIPYTEDKEVNLVISSFNNLISSIKNLNDEMLEQKNKELQLEIRNTEYMLNSLHSQINKHFLINILSIIRSFISCKETEKAKACIEDLSDFLRTSLTLGDRISVGEELNMVRSYLNIQAERYPRVKAEIICDEENNQTLIPKMILQPVIENCFVHGLQKKVGNIKIICKEKKDFIYFFIVDNGQGIEWSKVRTINNSLKAHKKIPFALGNGIALNNIEQRLSILAGEKSKIRVLSKKGYGTIVMLKICKGE